MSDVRRVAILSSASAGGAGIAARRLTDALQASDHLEADFIDIRSLGEAVPMEVSPRESFNNQLFSDTHFTAELPGHCRGWLVEMLRAYDLVNVHWATYLIGLAELHMLARAGKPMLFMMHDYHYTTGGCHYPAGCAQYGQGCKACPQLDTSRYARTVVARNYQIKRAIFAGPNVHISTPSQFLRDEVVNSGIVPDARAHVLRNPYAPEDVDDVNRHPTRRVLLIADSLQEGRKNMRCALEALARVRVATRNTQAVTVDVIGEAAPEMVEFLTATGVPHVFHGRISESGRLAGIMSKSDVVLTCSLEDNWPNILVEAGSYGCKPVVGPGHGCEEFVRRYGFGRVAADYSAEAFAIETLEALNDFSNAERDRVRREIRDEHAPDKVSRSFASLANAIQAGTEV